MMLTSLDFHGKYLAIFRYLQKSLEIFRKCLETFVRYMYQVENLNRNEFPYLLACVDVHVLFSILMLKYM